MSNIQWDFENGDNPGGPAGGDLSGTYPNPAVAKIGGKQISLGGPFSTVGASALTLRTIGATDITLPATGTLAILGANTFTGAQTFPAGTAAAPGVVIGNVGGLYQFATDILGISVLGKRATTIEYREIPYENISYEFGTGQPITTELTDTFVTTFGSPSNTITGTTSAAVFFNIGTIGLTAMDTITKTSNMCVLEMDKIDLSAGAGPVIFNRMQNTRFRFALPHQDVTIVDNVGIDFVMPNVTESGASVTNYKAIHFPALTGGAGTNFYGLFFENTPNQGSIATASLVDLTINAGISTGAGDVIIKGFNTILDNRGGGGFVRLYSVGKELVRCGTVGTAGSYLSLSANDVPQIFAAGSLTDVGLRLSSKGAGALQLFTGGGSHEGLRIIDAASAVNYATVTPGATGASVKLGAVSGTDANVSIELVPQGTGVVKVTSGKAFQLGNAYVATPSVPTGYLLLYDNTGTAYEIPANLH